jgi:hypothetical protein
VAIFPGTRNRCESAYVQTLCLVARAVGGDTSFVDAARRSLGALLQLHASPEADSKLALQDMEYGFRWAWISECVFEKDPSVNHALEILRGNIRLP